MIVILVHWLIKLGSESKFISTWENDMKIAKNQGLFREILTEVNSEAPDPKFHTFSLESPHYKTFINIGMWQSIEAFDKLVGAKYIPKTENINGKQTIELNNFEFKMRERIVLNVIADRGGQLPEAKLLE